MVELAPAVLVPNYVHAAAVEKLQRAHSVAPANVSVLATLFDAERSLSLAVPSMIAALMVPPSASSTGGFVLEKPRQGPHKGDS